MYASIIKEAQKYASFPEEDQKKCFHHKGSPKVVLLNEKKDEVPEGDKSIYRINGKLKLKLEAQKYVSITKEVR